jgi:hypothetical protein
VAQPCAPQLQDCRLQEVGSFRLRLLAANLVQT